MTITSFRQIRMARAALGWSLHVLADRSSVSARTLNRIETQAGFKSATPANLRLIRETLEAAGVEFIGSPGDGPGVRLWRED